MDKRRKEKDSLGTVLVPEERLWGAQTERSFLNFRIGTQKMPEEIITALISIKKAAAITNCQLGALAEEKKECVLKAIESITPTDIHNEFPLSVWQTGSGTQTNMNVNEVIANRASELAGQPKGTKAPVHPNDHVNKSQSSNDAFPTAMHIAFANAVTRKLIPALHELFASLHEKASLFHDIIKVGRTHIMDAIPMRLGDEFSGYAAQIEGAIYTIYAVMPRLLQLALGATAVGTGINCPSGFKKEAITQLSEYYQLPFRPAENPFEATASHDTAVELSGALKRAACALLKIANDIRLMGSGPRCGFGELHLPANEPGSSIMPGKVNPTQCEAAVQVACQIIGNDTTVALAASQGQFELNACKPVIALSCLDSIRLLSDVSRSFAKNCVQGLSADRKRIQELLDSSLALTTALSKEIGYDKAAEVALLATKENLTLKKAFIRLGLPEELFLQLTDLQKTV